MELDGITRVFIRCGGSRDPSMWPIYPVAVNSTEKLHGVDAVAVTERQDAHAINSEVFEATTDDRMGFGKQVKKDWAVYVNGEPVFDIDRMNTPRDEEYRTLAVEVERRLGKTGLTIVVS